MNMLQLIFTPEAQLTVATKNGIVQKIWPAGKRWKWINAHLQNYHLGSKVDLPKGTDLRVNADKLKDYAEVVELKQGELAIVLLNGVYSEILIPGIYAYWKGVNAIEILRFSTDELELPANLNENLRAILAARGFVRMFKVEQGEKGLVLLNGVLFKALEPGEYFYWNNSQSIKLLKANMKRRTIELNGQELLTKDKATLRINLLAEMRVQNVEEALLANSDYEKQAYYLLALALRSYVAELSLDELLSRKIELAEQIAGSTQAKFQAIGLELLEVGIRDIILPGEMREIMNQVLVAEKKAQANLITRREETASTRSLMNTAKLMENNPMLWKLKEMEYLEKVVEKVNTININGGEVGAKLREIFSSA